MTVFSDIKFRCASKLYRQLKLYISAFAYAFVQISHQPCFEHVLNIPLGSNFQDMKLFYRKMMFILFVYNSSLCEL